MRYSVRSTLCVCDLHCYRPSLWRTLAMGDLHFGGPETFQQFAVVVFFNFCDCILFRLCNASLILVRLRMGNKRHHYD